MKFRSRLLVALLCCVPAVAYAQWAVINSGAVLPAACRVGDIFVITSPPTLSACNVANTWSTLTLLTPSAAWGQVTGTLSNQTDLQTALNGKIATGGLAGTATTLATPRTINGVSFNGSANITVPAAGSTLTDAVTYANGGIGACAATSATTGTMTVSMVNPCLTITPTNACTFNATGGVAGQYASFIITTSGASSFVLTWGTNYKTTGTLATGVTTAKVFTVTFVYNGTNWIEVARTGAQ